MIRQLSRLLPLDFLLLLRYKVIGISIAITLIYIGAFMLLSNLGNIEKVLILLIFNDPALLGFLFVGVMVLFERNENTLQALAVSPIAPSHYILSKTIALGLIALFCCWAMAIAAMGWDFNFFHFSMATLFSSTIFSMFGFIVVAKESTFNNFIIKSLVVIVFLSLPFLAYFDICSLHWFWVFPTQGLILLFQYAFADAPPLLLLLAYSLCLFWLLLGYWGAKRAITAMYVRN